MSLAESAPRHPHDTGRDRLGQIAQSLEADARFVAAWLVGSQAGNQADPLSDLDLFVAVADEHAPSLCARPWHAAAATTEARLALFERFGRPALVYENHGNASGGGSYTFVLYDDGTAIDWFLVPQRQARRSADSRPLFEKTPIVVEDRAWGEAFAAARGDSAAERIGYFWLMAHVTAKHIVRGEPVDFHIKLDLLDRVADQIERLIEGRPWRYRRPSSVALATMAEEQLAAFRAVCDRVERLAATLGESASPRGVIEKVLSLKDKGRTKGPPVSLRRIDPAEREELREVVRGYWAELMPRSPAVHDPELGRAHFEDRFEFDRTELAHWWATTPAGERVGFARVELHEDNEGRWAYVSDFYIQPPHRRQGYGRAFASALLGRVANQGFVRIDLHVRRDSPGAFAFWQEMGFQLTSYRFRRYVEK